MLKQANSSSSATQGRVQVSLSLSEEVEQHLRSMAAKGYRSFGKEIAMRLTQSVQLEKHDEQQA